MIYLQLFFSFLQIGALSFGGGYAAMPLIQEQVVTMHGWLSMETFSDLVTIAEMTPGPIAVNSATFVGTRIAGPGGAVVATLGCILPSCIIVTLLAYIYTKYRKMSLLQGTLTSLRPAVVAMIAKAGVTILVSSFFINVHNPAYFPAVQPERVLYMPFIPSKCLLHTRFFSPFFCMINSDRFIY